MTMVPWSKNKPQYTGLVAGLATITLFFWIAGGPGFAVAFIIGAPIVAMAFAGFHGRRMR